MHLANAALAHGLLLALRMFRTAKLSTLLLALALAAPAGAAPAGAAETEALMMAARGRGDHENGAAQRALLSTFARLDRADGAVRDAHGEKTALAQAAELRLLAMAWADWRGASFRSTARGIEAFVARSLTSPEGAFYAAPGAARIDAEANAELIRALAELAAVMEDASTFARARAAAEYAVAHLKAEDGYGTPAATLTMARASLALYRATGHAEWLAEARLQAKHAGAVELAAELAALEGGATLAAR